VKYEHFLVFFFCNFLTAGPNILTNALQLEQRDVPVSFVDWQHLSEGGAASSKLFFSLP
jgi:hypothetical protein